MSAEGTFRPEAYAHAPFLRPLAALSAAMGQDITQVQGPGGNTSIKRENILWVKASGTDLADADGSCIFVPVSLETAHAVIDSGDDRSIPALDISQAEGMRPSIECSLHALMPHGVVLHNHDVNVITWAARADAEAALAEPLQDLNWAFVPYARPGLPLTHAVKAILNVRTPDILILGNHGLVVGGDTPAHAEDLLETVRERLRLAPRSVPDADIARLTELCQGTRFAPALLPEAHWTALDPLALHFAVNGVLYPDHVVFLGAEVAVLSPDDIDGLVRTKAQLVVIPGAGVIIEKGLPQAAQAMAACLGMVATRFPANASPGYLETGDIAALLGWDAEKYRQEMARRKAVAMQG